MMPQTFAHVEDITHKKALHVGYETNQSGIS